MAEAKKIVGKIKRKVWFEIISPKLFKNASIGETLVTDKEQLIGKEISSSLANLTGDIKRQSTVIKFKVTEIKDNKAIADIIGYFILPTHIRRMMRKGRQKVDHSFVCKTKDDSIVRVKFVLITKSFTKRKVLAGLRKTGEDILVSAIKDLTYSNLISDVVAYKIQRALKDHLKKIFPLKICEIRHISLVVGKQVKIKEPKKEEKKEDKPEEEGDQNAETEN